ncbi:MAG TPA: glycosyltransferase family 2 protein [Pyrinomonadaceae bacterium]
MPQASSVSVIIRTYNQHALLKEAIESALNQTLRPAEIIVVDDASTDETPLMMRDYEDEATIQYVRLEENQGMLRTGQIGLERSAGDLIAFLDNDDLWLPAHLEKCVAAIESKAGAALAFSRYGLIDLQGHMLVEQVREKPLSVPPLKTLLFKKVIATPTRSVYPRRVLLELGGIRPILWDWVYPVLIAAKYPKGIVQLPECTALFRLHGGQSYSNPEKLLNSLLESTEYIFNELPAEYQHLKPRVVAMNLLHSAVFYWQAEKNREAWECLRRAVRTDSRCTTTKDFRVAFTRLLIPPRLGRLARNWKRKTQQKRSASSLHLSQAIRDKEADRSAPPKRPSGEQ